MEPVDFRSRRTRSAGMASAASFATLSPGSSAHAIPAGVAAFHYSQLVYVYIKKILLSNKTHIALSNERIIIAAVITSGEKNDGKYLQELIEKSKQAGMDVDTVIGDTAYSEKANIDYTKEEQIRLVSKLNPDHCNEF